MEIIRINKLFNIIRLLHPTIKPSTYLFVYLSLYLPAYIITCLSVALPTHPTIHPFIHFFNTRWFKYDRDWFVCKSGDISSGHIWTTLYLCVDLSNSPSTQHSVRPPIHAPIHLLICPSVNNSSSVLAVFYLFVCVCDLNWKHIPLLVVKEKTRRKQKWTAVRGTNHSVGIAVYASTDTPYSQHIHSNLDFNLFLKVYNNNNNNNNNKSLEQLSMGNSGTRWNGNCFTFPLKSELTFY